MGTLTALVLATPIFGFALAPPEVSTVALSSAPQAQIEVAAESVLAVAAAASQSAAEKQQYRDQLRKRAKLAKIHRTMGIATWAATAVAVIAGTIQYRNLYGKPFASELGDTPCVQGNAWPNQDQCHGGPWLHAIPGFAAGALYFSTLGLEMAMPDPDDAAAGDSKYAKTLRTHKALRWVHLAGMAVQIVTGIIVANPGLALDRANDYDTLKKLGGLHLGSGLVTLGALTWAGSIMLF